jgi:hypothetical protein
MCILQADIAVLTPSPVLCLHFVAYYHEQFLRDQPELADTMQRAKSLKGPGNRKVKASETEPDFYALPSGHHGGSSDNVGTQMQSHAQSGHPSRQNRLAADSSQGFTASHNELTFSPSSRRNSLATDQRRLSFDLLQMGNSPSIYSRMRGWGEPSPMTPGPNLASLLGGHPFGDNESAVRRESNPAWGNLQDLMAPILTPSTTQRTVRDASSLPQEFPAELQQMHLQQQLAQQRLQPFCGPAPDGMDEDLKQRDLTAINNMSSWSSSFAGPVNHSINATPLTNPPQLGPPMFAAASSMSNHWDSSLLEPTPIKEPDSYWGGIVDPFLRPQQSFPAREESKASASFDPDVSTAEFIYQHEQEQNNYEQLLLLQQHQQQQHLREQEQMRMRLEAMQHERQQQGWRRRVGDGRGVSCSAQRGQQQQQQQVWG